MPMNNPTSVTCTRRDALAEGIAQGFGVGCTLEFRLIFAPLVNDADATQSLIRAAEDLVGAAQVDRDGAPNVASEDFSFMLEKVPGAYMLIGNGLDSAPVHNPRYDFNDAALPYGAALFTRLAQARPAR